MAKIYHVAQHGGCDRNNGSEQQPFATINHAADLALPGDQIIVHAGVYREAVRPRSGGRNRFTPITYKAAPNEKVVIKGSEQITTWEKFADATTGAVYRAVIDNKLFGDFNPYATKLFGDWLIEPYPCNLHLGDVYLDGVSLFEAGSIDELKNPIRREHGPCIPWHYEPNEKLLHPEHSVRQWYAEVDDQCTIIYVNFGDIDPKEHCIEINVREFCFAPLSMNTNYINIDGFEICHSACQWAPPTGVQRGMIDTYWSKGWKITNCHLHDAKNSAISLGKEITTGNCESYRFKMKPGYQMQLEAVFKALKRGWSFEMIGSHEVAHNDIHDCGQNGVVGHLGCINSHIHHNRIYNIAKKHEYFGYEIAGIKLHAALDVRIDHNEFDHCSLGIWLDWQAQGARISQNVFYANDRDLMIEVTHGPCLVDNNIFASDYNFDNVAQGTAMVNNIFAGTTRLLEVPNRATPYHAAHSTDVTGYAFVYCGDDRLYGNLFLGGAEYKEQKRGTAFYDRFCASWEEYNAKTLATGVGDNEQFDEIKDAVYINHNGYLNGAPSFNREASKVVSAQDSKLQVYRNEHGLFMEIDVEQSVADYSFKALDTAALGTTRLTECQYENPDGSSLVVNTDLLDHIHGDTRCLGPVNLKAGHNCIKIWD